jgi:sarcosine oxidase subunit alpha
MTQPFRLAAGGRIDRQKPLTISFDGAELSGFAGDTLASILVANGVRITSRGIYSGRPRGLMSAGAEESNTFVQVLSGALEPMRRATEIEAYDGLVVRSLAGKGTLARSTDVSRYDKKFKYVETLVVGGGSSGVAAAARAASEGGRVLLIHDGPDIAGGMLPHDVTVLTRTTATNLHEQGYVIAVERRTDHLATPPENTARQRLWKIRARRVVLATGAHERPIAFAGNDVPGVMLAASAVEFATRYGVQAGNRAVVFGAHDGALHAALKLLDAGIDVAAVVDARCDVRGELAGCLSAAGVSVCEDAVVSTETSTDGVLTGVVIQSPAATEFVACDLLAVSGGWNPALQLFTHAGGRTRWSDASACFVPNGGPSYITVAGRATGEFAAALRPAPVFCVEKRDAGSANDGSDSAIYLDLQRDATLADLRRSIAAGMRSIEHVKRYTSISTAVDQGRTSGVLTVGVLCQELGVPLADGITTAHRPPYTPISFALLAGRDHGALADPERVSPIHDWHVDRGACFENVGQWKRPSYFPAFAGESLSDAVRRECAAARTGVAMMDASTLGKIELHGKDAGVFLDRVYTNMVSTLPVGRVRYLVMCGLDGMVMDDGTVARLADDRWIVTTTTGNAAGVFGWFEEWLQTEWPALDVRCTSVTEQWATIAVVGPKSREVIGAIAPALDVSNAAFPFMEWRDAIVGGCAMRIMRISFSGELAYEVNVPGWYGQAMWEAIYDAGQPYRITPYGTETLHVLRAEKGYPIIGQETDGTVSPFDLGLHWAVSRKKADFIGKRSHERADALRGDRKQLVGLLPVDGTTRLIEGAQLVEAGVSLDVKPVKMIGHVTSAYDSVTVGTPFALALLANGAARHGDEIQAVDQMVATLVRVTAPVFYDQPGARRDGD